MGENMLRGRTIAQELAKVGDRFTVRRQAPAMEHGAKLGAHDSAFRCVESTVISPGVAQRSGTARREEVSRCEVGLYSPDGWRCEQVLAASYCHESFCTNSRLRSSWLRLPDLTSLARYSPFPLDNSLIACCWSMTGFSFCSQGEKVSRAWVLGMLPAELKCRLLT